MYQYIVLTTILMAQAAFSLRFRPKSFKFPVRSMSMNNLAAIFRLKLEEMEEEPDSPVFNGDSISSEDLLDDSFELITSLPPNTWDFDTIGSRHNRDDIATCCLLAFLELHKQNAHLKKKVSALRDEVGDLQSRVERLETERSRPRSGSFSVSSSIDFNGFSTFGLPNSGNSEVENDFDTLQEDFMGCQDLGEKEIDIEPKLEDNFYNLEDINQDQVSKSRSSKCASAHVCSHNDSCNNSRRLSQRPDSVTSSACSLTHANTNMANETSMVETEPKSVNAHDGVMDEVDTAVKSVAQDSAEENQTAKPITITVVKQSVHKTHLISIFAIMFAMLVLTCAMILFVVVFKRIDRRYGLSAIDAIAQDQELIAAATVR